MKVVCIGGGPGGLYASILLAKAFPSADVQVFERNGPDDTFGWGVVFSRETLGNLEAADPETFAEITERFAYWDDIETWYGGDCVTSTGHGFCGMSRKTLLQVLQSRARDLGVQLHFEHEVAGEHEFGDADLVIAADGIHSAVRDADPDHFRPSFDWRKAKFVWLGTTRPLRAFTFVFLETEWGVFQVHAYPFEADLATWIVECHEDTWRRAGLDQATEEETVAFCERIFADHLDGHALRSNKSIWRTFPTISCERWHRDNVVLLGDAVHTAHFSIGSGTKLAMEDSIALVEALREHGVEDVPSMLAAYQAAREVDVAKLQKAAQTSLEWFENSDRYMGQHPVQFSFNLLTRSKRITYDNLRLRDPAFVGRVTAWFSETVDPGLEPRTPPALTPFRVRGMELRNRIVLSPMCQYTATDGVPDDWHLVHLGSRALGGAGLVLTEMTNVSAEGRITRGCTGIYTDEQARAWRRVTDFVHANSQARVGIQLGHAGWKGSCEHPWEGHDVPLPVEDGGWETLGPSAVPFHPDWPAPRAMTRADMDRVREEYAAATRRSIDAGFDAVEVHMAHGYLLHAFLSPISNRRTDEYGGSLENRARYPLEVLRACRAAWPTDRPLLVRISATDWIDGGFTGEESVRLAEWLRDAGCDVLDVSTSGISPAAQPLYGRMFQVPFADRIRHAIPDLPVMTVGAVLGIDHANTIVAAGRADLCALARVHLRDPYLTLRSAAEYGYDGPGATWPEPYLLGKPTDGVLLQEWRRAGELAQIAERAGSVRIE